MDVRRTVMLVSLVLAALAVTCLRPAGGQLRVCKQPKVIGVCRAAFTRYYFDSSRRTCRLFLYGGCGGNSNNFRTMKACRRRCFLMLRRDICQLPPRTGPCRAGFTRYHYDNARGECRPFTYGGCMGNRNRFNSLEECNQRCAA